MAAADLLEKYGRSADAAEYIKARVQAVPWDFSARVRLGGDLSAVVADANTPYAVRVEAARRGAHGGDGELALLARGHITAAEANRPYYYEARLEAAQTAADAATRVPLLLDAVAVHPDLQAPLLPLFQAAYRSARYELAYEAARRYRWTPWSGPVENARELSAAFERADDYMAASGVLHAAEKVDTSAPVREQLKREAGDVERRAEVKRENQARRPHIAASVEQNHAVRPRIER
jgi:hypothetical protein